MPDDAVKAEKKELRKRIKQQLRDTPHDAIADWSQRITERLCGLTEYRDAKAIMVYASLPGEFLTDALIEHAIGAGKVVCGPKIDWDDREMFAAKVDSRDDFIVDAHGVEEPRTDQVFPAEKLDLVLVPGLAFDGEGRRLGRGGGFYDKFLSRLESGACRAAATFDLQIVPSIPVTAHDQPVQMLVTQTQVRRFAPRL